MCHDKTFCNSAVAVFDIYSVYCASNEHRIRCVCLTTSGHRNVLPDNYHHLEEDKCLENIDNDLDEWPNMATDCITDDGQIGK